MTDRPRIGDFAVDRSPRKRENEEKEKELEIAVPPPTDDEKAAEKRISLYDDIQGALTPVEDYHKYLKEVGISEEEAAEVIDDIFVKGYYEETYDLTKRIKVTFRTRQHQDTVRIQRALQIQQPIYTESMQELQIRYSLAASLAVFGDRKFAFPDFKASVDTVEELFNIRLRFIENLASAAVLKLSVKLAKFDRKTNALMREGVAENF